MSIDIERNFNKVVTVQRLDADMVGYTEEYANHLLNVACHIQPLDDSYSQDIEGSFGKEWLMFCNVFDILEGDRIVDGSDEYRVVSVESYKFLCENRHMELRIRKANP